MNQKLVIISAPSGAGKSTLVGQVLPGMDNLEFSISATSRDSRGAEEHGVHYYFLSPDDFRNSISEEHFIEWEEVYPNQYYGTLKSEVERLWKNGKAVIFDIDVVGGLNLKRMFGNQAIAIFIQPPSEKELEKRLRGRGTDSEEKIQTRLGKAKQELARSSEFDVVIVNDDLKKATEEVRVVIEDFLKE